MKTTIWDLGKTGSEELWKRQKMSFTRPPLALVDWPLCSRPLALPFWSLLSVKSVISHVHLSMNVFLVGSCVFIALQSMEVVFLYTPILLDRCSNLVRLATSDVTLQFSPYKRGNWGVAKSSVWGPQITVSKWQVLDKKSDLFSDSSEKYLFPCERNRMS